MNISNFTNGHITTSEANLPDICDKVTLPSMSGGLIDEATVNLVSTVSYTYISPVLFVFGTIGNVLSLVVLCADKKRNTTTIILIALAISDLGLILTMFTRSFSYILRYFNASLARNYRTVLLAHMKFIQDIFSRATNLITTLISMERLTAVLFPLKVNVIFTSSRVVTILVASYVVTFSLIFPMFLMGAIKWVNNPLTNASTAVYYYTSFFLDKPNFWKVYTVAFLNSILILAPRVVVGFNTAVIIITLKKAKAWRQDMSKSTNQATSAKDNRLTYMLVTICGIFIVCSVPEMFHNIMTVAAPKTFHFFGKYRNLHNLSTPIVSVTKFFNSSINFVVYMVLNSRFARTFKQIFGCTAKE